MRKFMNKEDQRIYGLVRNILQRDLHTGSKAFLEYAYNKLNLHDNKRMVEMSDKYPKETLAVKDFAYENILGIVLEEFMDKKNSELLFEMCDYYKQRYLNIIRKFEKCEKSHSKFNEFVEKEISSGKREAVEINFIILHYLLSSEVDPEDRRALLHGYDSLWSFLSGDTVIGFSWNGNGDYISCLEKKFNLKNIREEKIYIRYIEKQRKILADYLKIAPDEIENHIIQHSDVSAFIYGKDIVGGSRKVPFTWVEICMRQIYDKYNLSWETIFGKKEKIYRDIIKWEFEHLCICLILSKRRSYREQKKKLEFNMIISQASIEDPQAAYMQLVSLFYSDLLASTLREALDLYCKEFSIDKTGEKIENKLVSEVNELKRELALSKEQLKKSEEIDSRQKQKQYQALLETDREHAKQITSLEKKLSDQEQLNRELKQRLSDQEQYIKLLKMPKEKNECGNELPDISHVRDKRIAFIGGLPETIKKMKQEFYHAVFITDDTADIPQKIDAMVMFPDFMSHSLFYKYIPLTREKGVQLVYCNSTNTDLILRKIGRELLTANA